MACEVGLYYVLHITKQRNKNALLRLLPGLGECGQAAVPGPGLLPCPSTEGLARRASPSLSSAGGSGAGVGAAQLGSFTDSLRHCHRL